MSRSQYPFQKERLGTMLKIKITFCLVASFFVAFLFTTIATDFLAEWTGFYAEGRADSAALERGEF
jgi:hypothetical protein